MSFPPQSASSEPLGCPQPFRLGAGSGRLARPAADVILRDLEGPVAHAGRTIARRNRIGAAPSIGCGAKPLSVRGSGLGALSKTIRPEMRAIFDVTATVRAATVPHRALIVNDLAEGNVIPAAM